MGPCIVLKKSYRKELKPQDSKIGPKPKQEGDASRISMK